MTEEKLKGRDADSPARPNHRGLGGSTPVVAAPPDTDQHTALEHARRLAEAGVPLFLARPALDEAGQWNPRGGHNGCGYVLPPRWQLSEADPAIIGRWRPGMALAAVTGHVVDVVDVDPRNGGHDTYAEHDGQWPASYGRQATPSGGWHDLTAPLGVVSKGALPGVDVKAGLPDGSGRGFIWLAPTRKRSRATGEIGEYRWTTPPNLDALGVLGEPDPSGEWLAEQVNASRRSQDAREPYDGLWYDELPEDRQRQAGDHVEAVLASWHRQYAEAAGWPEGQTDDRGRGWEALARDGAWALALLAAHPAYPLTDSEAEAAYLGMLGPLGDDPRCAGKWGRALANAADETPEAVPWLSTPAEDFGPASADETPAAAGSGWGRFDLGSVLAEVEAGNLELPRPDVCMTASGALFYDGKVNGLAGDSGAGKTWIALAGGLQEMRKGRPCVLLDYEDGPKTAVLRLRALGAPLDLIHDLLDYRQPVLHDPKAIAAMVAEVAGAYVILDSTGESMSLAGLSSNDDGETGKWLGAIARPLSRAGCCVVLLDHMVKSNDGGLWPIGSQRKRAGLDGAQYVAEVIEPFSRKKDGCVAIKVAKDRSGAEAAGDVATYVRFEPGFDGGLSVSFGPGASAADAAERRAEKAAEKVAVDVEELDRLDPPPTSFRDVRERMGWGQARAEAALRTYRENRK
ncbi:MAG: AAA family ATPase [Micropruina sp.]|uniref:AAA family ATPase n=1 Tax=Micropruina sp. TaxID=2737536 RepID=UPI0039E2F25E